MPFRTPTEPQASGFPLPKSPLGSSVKSFPAPKTLLLPPHFPDFSLFLLFQSPRSGFLSPPMSQPLPRTQGDDSQWVLLSPSGPRQMVLLHPWLQGWGIPSPPVPSLACSVVPSLPTPSLFPVPGAEPDPSPSTAPPTTARVPPRLMVPVNYLRAHCSQTCTPGQRPSALASRGSSRSLDICTETPGRHRTSPKVPVSVNGSSPEPYSAFLSPLLPNLLLTTRCGLFISVPNGFCFACPSSPGVGSHRPSHNRPAASRRPPGPWPEAPPWHSLCCAPRNGHSLAVTGVVRKRVTSASSTTVQESDPLPDGAKNNVPR